MEERVAKNLLETEKMRLVAELQAVPDCTVWTAQIAEQQRELLFVQSEKEGLHREVSRLKHELDCRVQSAHILHEKEDKIHELQVALKVSKKKSSKNSVRAFSHYRIVENFQNGQFFG